MQKAGRRKTKSPAGLHLWKVRVEYRYLTGRLHVGLWITTARNSIEQGMKKADGFLKRHKDEYPSPQVEEVRYYGTIDV